MRVSRRPVCCAITSLVLAVGASLGVSAQTRATIVGTITDGTGARLPQVTVVLSSPDLVGGAQTSTSGADGQYRFPELVPGRYHLVAHLAEFQTVERQDIRVDFGMTVIIDFSLDVASVDETIMVSGVAPTVDVKTAASASKLSTEELQALPLMVDRRASGDIISLTPGTNSNSAFGAPRQSANGLMLDGQSSNLPEFGGVNGAVISTNWLEELQVVGLGANAEYGEFSGIGANMVLRAGSNRFAGLGEYVFGRDQWLSDNRGGLPAALRERFTPLRSLTNFDSSAQIGGPVRKDKLVFFAGVQYYHKEQMPAGAIGGATTDERWPKGVVKINWAAASAVKVEGFVETDRDQVDGAGAGPTNTPDALQTIRAPKTLWNGRVTWTPSDRTLVEVHSGGLVYEQQLFPTAPRTIDGPPPRRDTTTGVTSVNTFAYTQRNQERLRYAGSLTRFADGFGGVTHQFKVGAEFERTEATTRTGTPGGIAYLDLANNTPNQAQIWAGDRVNGVGRRTTFYVQDRWTVNTRLTLEPGIRVSFNRGSTPDRGTVFKANPISPRLGAAWDVGGAHRTVLRASYGRFHDPNFTTLYQFMNTSTQTPRITARVLGPDTFQELTRVTPASNYGIDPDITQSYTDHYVAGIEHQLMAYFSLTAQYVRLNTNNVMGFVDTGSLYVPATAPDPGPDGRLGTADDGPRITVYSLTNPGNAFLLFTNPDGAYRRYDGFQVIGKKRFSQNWQAQLSYTRSKARGSVNNLINENAGSGADTGMTGAFVNPNRAINGTGPNTLDFPHQVNLNGTYRVPYFGGLNVSAVYRYISGGAWGRTAVITAASATPTLRQGNETVRIETRGTRRTEAVNQLDFRFEKTFSLAWAASQVSVFADLYNVNNQGVVVLPPVTEVSGANFGAPANWREPRTLLVGFKASF